MCVPRARYDWQRCASRHFWAYLRSPSSTHLLDEHVAGGHELAPRRANLGAKSENGEQKFSVWHKLAPHCAHLGMKSGSCEQTWQSAFNVDIYYSAFTTVHDSSPSCTPHLVGLQQDVVLVDVRPRRRGEDVERALIFGVTCIVSAKTEKNGCARSIAAGSPLGGQAAVQCGAEGCGVGGWCSTSGVASLGGQVAVRCGGLRCWEAGLPAPSCCGTRCTRM